MATYDGNEKDHDLLGTLPFLAYVSQVAVDHLLIFIL